MTNASNESGTDNASPRAARNKAAAIHVDTSLHIEQRKRESLAAPVRKALQQFPFRSTSTYARLEFKRAWLRDLALLYKAAENKPDIGAVQDAIVKSNWHPQRKRNLERCLQAISKFLSRSRQGLSPAAEVNKLRNHLATAILGAFVEWQRSYTHEFDGTGCVRSKERPLLSPSGALDVSIPHCRPDKIECTVHTFFVQHVAEFEKIKSEIERRGDAVSDELKRTKATIDAAKEKPEFLCNDDHCKRMSDSIIAVDGVEVGRFGANNDKEWSLISEALGCELVNPVRDARAAETKEPNR